MPHSGRSGYFFSAAGQWSGECTLKKAACFTAELALNKIRLENH
jgi:hypothetical protein